MNHVISISLLSKTYTDKKNKIQALKEITFDVSQGSVISLLGPNGSGKTTLVKIVMGLVIPDGGECIVSGRKLPDAGARRMIGYLPEVYDFPKKYTGARFLHMMARIRGLPGREINARVVRVMKMFGLEERAGDRIEKYSKGMKQRLALCQALLHDPHILILDEPTDGVDPVGRIEIRDLLLQFRDNGVTILMNSHLLSEVEAISDRIAIINSGELAAIGTKDEIIGGIKGTRIIIELDSDKAIPELLMKFKYEREGTRLKFEVRDQQSTESIMEIVQNERLTLIEYSPIRNSLEESFLKHIKLEI
jgi:ABC-2 type transport system ATP-binding protein